MLFGKIIKQSNCVVFLGVAALIVFSSLQTAMAEEYFKSFEWYYEGSRWTWDLCIPKSLYDSYKGVSVSDRIKYGVAGYDFLVTTQDSYMRLLASKLHKVAAENGYESYDEVSFVLSFVQSLPYTSDSVTAGYDEYPRFPIETLVDDGGDCEDTSILFATIVLILNYSAVFISPPDHLAVGVWGTELSGYYYTFDDRTYYYCETTGEDWKIGDVPDEFPGTTADIYSINLNAQYIPDQNPLEPFLMPDLSLLLMFAVSCGIVIGILYLFRRRVRKDEDVIKPELESIENRSPHKIGMLKRIYDKVTLRVLV
jgi:hypothetical protein